MTREKRGMRGAEASGPLRVKICGLTRAEDAAVAAEAGADFMGAVLSPGFGRSVSPDAAATFRDAAGGDDAPTLVAVLVDATAEQAEARAVEAGAGVLQLHGDESPALLRTLRERGPWRIWKAVRVREADEVLRAAETYGAVADGLLLDGAREGTRGGGHGIRFPWEAVAAVREDLPGDLALIVAGGLTPGNVATAVRALRPDVVDVSSGVEATPGVKDPERVLAFVRAARNADGPGGSMSDADAGPTSATE